MAWQRQNRNLTVLAVAVATALLAAAAAPAVDLRLTTDNDFLADNDRADDLYTFALALEVEKGGWTWALRENAFTDREAGLRFDESSVTLGRHVPREWLGPWSLWVEAGAVHVGRGLLGQSVQNSFHDAIGSDRVDLEYPGDSGVHARLALELDRQWIVARRWSVGPRVTAHVAPGFKRGAFAGVRGRWIPNRVLDVDFELGGRWAETDLALLEPHLRELAGAASVEALLWDRLIVRWSLNRYGTGNEHFSLGVRVGTSRSARRDGPWREAGGGG